MPQRMIREHIEMLRRNTMRYFVTDLTHGYVMIGENGCFRGRIVYMAKHMGTPMYRDRSKMLQELNLVGSIVNEAFGSLFMMGETSQVMYWHTVPPCEDCDAERAIWWLDLSAIMGDGEGLDDKELDALRDRLAWAFGVL